MNLATDKAQLCCHSSSGTENLPQVPAARSLSRCTAHACHRGCTAATDRHLSACTISQWDIIAGLSVGAMMVPSGLSYAAIAGLPAVMGLYSAFVPCLVYALFGSSRQLSVGPVALTSLLIGTGMAEVLPGEGRPVLLPCC